MKKNIFIISNFLGFSLCMIACNKNIMAISPEVVQPKGAVCEEYDYYSPTTTNNVYTFDLEGEYKNNGAQVQSKTITYTTTYSSSVSTGLSAEFKLITSKIGVNAIVSAGESKTVSLSSTFNISPKHIGYYKVGQKSKKTSGKIVSVLSNCTTKSKSISAKYSFGPYDVYSEEAI